MQEDRARSFSLLEASDLEEFLAASGAVGELAGRGEFSLNLTQAMQNLEKFTLSEPGFYVRYLVASAVARGATRIEVRTAVQTLVIEDDGVPFDFDSLTNALPALLNSQTTENAGRRYLAVGLCGARALGFRRASVTCPQASLVLEKSRLELMPRNSEVAGTRVEITERKSLASFAGTLLKKQSLWEHVETALQTFRYLNAELTFNGQKMNLKHPVFQAPYVKIGKPGGARRGELACVETDLAISGYISLSSDFEGPLSLILHGICFESGLGSMCALIYCDELRLNASFQGLVQNEMFQSVVEEVALKQILAGLTQIAKAETDREVFDMVAATLGPLQGRMPEAVETAVWQSSIAGRPYQDLRSTYERSGFLPIEAEMRVAATVLQVLFPACVRLNEVRVPDSLEVLRGASGAVYRPPERPYILRFDESLMERPCPCVPGGDSLPMGDELAPHGFQLLWTELYAPQNDFLFQFNEFRDFGLCVYRAVENGLFSMARVRPFFLNLLEWMLDIGGHLARKEPVRGGLVLEQEDGRLLNYGTLLQTGGNVPYRLESEPRSGLTHALRLSDRELRLIQDLGEVALVPGGH
ncbi:MAG: hypothetical protein KC800_02475 [Candidatus Eremiobacteraeota bacterium]|nr:hypothetical protein [Candidatus Eremiobacteraeota bacterium]